MTPTNDFEKESQSAKAEGEEQDIAPPKRRRGRPRKSESETKPRRKRYSSLVKEIQEAPEGTAWDALKNPEQYALPPHTRSVAAQQAGQLRGDAPREQMNVRIHSELKRAAQILAAAKNVSLGDVVEEALIEYIKRQ